MEADMRRYAQRQQAIGCQKAQNVAPASDPYLVITFCHLGTLRSSEG
jgi:hypothetical protein